MNGGQKGFEQTLVHPLKDIRQVVSVKLATLLRLQVLKDISPDELDLADPGPDRLVVLLDQIIRQTVLATLLASKDILGVVVVPDRDVAHTVADLAQQEGADIQADVLKELGVATQVAQGHLAKEGACAGSPDPSVPDRVKELGLLGQVLTIEEGAGGRLVVGQGEDVLAVETEKLFETANVNDLVTDQVQVLVPVGAVLVVCQGGADFVLVQADTSLGANVLATKLESKELGELFVLQGYVGGDLQCAQGKLSGTEVYFDGQGSKFAV